MSDELPILNANEAPHPDIRVYGAPRPAVPQRLPVAPRTRGCASGAGSGVGADAAAGSPGGFRRLPDWLKVKLPGAGEYAETKALLRQQKLVTVCEEARCPNLGHCWSRGTATIMILGDLCTRRCGFCAVAPGKPNVGCDAAHFWSFHTAGSQFLMGDGSCRMVRYSDNNILAALSTRAGGEVANIP